MTRTFREVFFDKAVASDETVLLRTSAGMRRRQYLMNMRGCDGGMAGTDGDLMKIGHNITCCIDSFDCRALVLIDLETTDLVGSGAETGRKI